MIRNGVYVKGTVDHIGRGDPNTAPEFIGKLKDTILNDDHPKSCQGRYTNCSCGYEARLENWLEQCLAEIVRLNEEITALKKKPIGTQP